MFLPTLQYGMFMVLSAIRIAFAGQGMCLTRACSFPWVNILRTLLLLVLVFMVSIIWSLKLNRDVRQVKPVGVLFTPPFLGR